MKFYLKFFLNKLNNSVYGAYKLWSWNSIKLQDKSFKVTQVNVGGAIKGGASAGGTQSASGGKTLMGELGRELVVSGNQYYTVGDLGAEFVNLRAGDIVFNHEDTEKLLKGLTGVRGQALAQGTAMAGRVSGGGSLSNLSAYKATSASAVQSQTTATVNVNVKTGAKDLSEALEDQLKTLKEELDDILDQFDFKIFMAEKHNASSKEIIEIYRKMQETVHAQAEKYRKMGVDENNEYIRDLQKQWWEYEEAIREARKDEFDEWLKDSKFSIEAMQNDREGTDKVAGIGQFHVVVLHASQGDGVRVQLVGIVVDLEIHSVVLSARCGAVKYSQLLD